MKYLCLLLLPLFMACNKSVVEDACSYKSVAPQVTTEDHSTLINGLSNLNCQSGTINGKLVTQVTVCRGTYYIYNKATYFQSDSSTSVLGTGYLPVSDGTILISTDIGDTYCWATISSGLFDPKASPPTKDQFPTL